MVKKLSSKSGGLSVDELTQNEIMAVDRVDKIVKLERELEKQKDIVLQYKEREKLSARALVLYERKVKFLKNLVATKTSSAVNLLSEQTKEISEFSGQNQSLDKAVFDKILKEISQVGEELDELSRLVERSSKISAEDRDFIADKKKPEKSLDINERFNRLKMEFSEKIGLSVNKRPGRPKKEDQSIVADLKLGKSAEKEVAEKAKVNQKLSSLFYEVPKAQKSTPSVPKTSDSVFDFDEALNPDMSLSDIMKDLIGEGEAKKLGLGLDEMSKERKKSELTPKTEKVEAEKTTINAEVKQTSKPEEVKRASKPVSDEKPEPQKAEKKQSGQTRGKKPKFLSAEQIERIEAGIFASSGGIIGSARTLDEIHSPEKKAEKKLTFEEKYLFLQDIMNQVK